MSETEKNLKARFEALIAFIREAQDTVENGTVVDLGDLDMKVSKICEDVENSEPSIAKNVQPLMADMITHLDALAQSLSKLQDQQEGPRG